MSILVLQDEAVGPSVVAAGLQALYRFDDGAGQTLTDYSGQERHGMLGSTEGPDTNDPSWDGEGLGFTTDDYVECGNDAALRTDAWTVCAALRPTTSTVFPIVGWGATGQFPALYAAAPFNANRPLIWLGNNCFRYFEKSSPVDLLDGGWHFVVFSTPGNSSADIMSAEMTVDGVAQDINSTQTTTEGATKAQMRIGRAGSSTFANGGVGFLALHNRVLSAAEKEQMRTYAASALLGRIVLP